MATRLRKLVSQHRRRYVYNDFSSNSKLDLDLSYITDRLIAMSFPSERIEAIYRNNIDEVVKFLDTKHYNHYKIYNLCSEKRYDPAKFHNRVACEYSFDDHSVIPLGSLISLIKDLMNWLNLNERNVACVHCKAGKGRSGLVLSSALLNLKKPNGEPIVSDSSEALQYYAEKRTLDNRGVTIPSQRRYVDYYHKLVKFNLKYIPVRVVLWSINLEPNSTNLINGHFVVSQLDPHDRKCRQVISKFLNEEPLHLQGDIKVEFVQQKSKISKKEKLFSFWFNTFFVVGNNNHNNYKDNHQHEHDDNKQRYGNCDDLKLVFYKEHLDKAHKDTTNKLFSEDFKVILKFKRAPPHSVL